MGKDMDMDKHVDKDSVVVRDWGGMMIRVRIGIGIGVGIGIRMGMTKTT